MIINSPTRLDIPALRAIWREAFGDGDAFLDGFFTTAYAPDRARVARLDGDIAGALYWFDCECDNKKIAYLYAVATAKSQRGKGVCTALMSDTHAHLKSLGYVGAILVPGETSLFDFYKRLNYEIFSGVNEIATTASAHPCRLVKINASRYGQLRRKYLPHGAVIQEGASLDFLATLADFFEGEDFILAARKEGDTLVGLELLGNASPENATAITRALGADKGRFRTPGTKRPFAMCLPLSESFTLPTHFGLAFD